MAQGEESGEGLKLAYLYDKGYDWIAGIVLGGVHAIKDASLVRRSHSHGDGVGRLLLEDDRCCSVWQKLKRRKGGWRVAKQEVEDDRERLQGVAPVGVSGVGRAAEKVEVRILPGCHMHIY